MGERPQRLTIGAGALAGGLAGAFVGLIDGLRAAGRSRPGPVSPPGAAAALLSPLAAAVLGAAIFIPLSQTRWLVGRELTHRMFMAAAPALLLPLAFAMLAEVRLPIRRRPAVALAVLAYGGAAAFAMSRAWADNLRFAPWTELATAAAIAAVAAVLAATARGRLP